MIMTIDPGEHIGVIIAGMNKIYGITLEGETRNEKLWHLLMTYRPDTIIYESFALRASVAQKLVGNKFITCEVIGVIKLYCQLDEQDPIVLQPASKEYCGFSSSPKDEHYKEIKMLDNQKITEHVRDAYRLYNYAKIFSLKSAQN